MGRKFLQGDEAWFHEPDEWETPSAGLKEEDTVVGKGLRRLAAKREPKNAAVATTPALLLGDHVGLKSLEWIIGLLDSRCRCAQVSTPCTDFYCIPDLACSVYNFDSKFAFPYSSGSKVHL